MTIRRRLAGAAAASAFVVLSTGPAMATEAPQAASFSVLPAADAKGAISSTDTPTVKGEFKMTGSNTVQSVAITVKSVANPPVMQPLQLDGCNSPNPCPAPSVAFTKKLPKLAFNGTYEATAKAVGRENPADVDGDQEGTAGPVRFRLEVPPIAPREVRVATTANPRTAVVSWDRNGEPDMLFYMLQRKLPGDSAYRPLSAFVAQPPGGSGGRVTFKDESVGDRGGDVTYQVFAIRRSEPGDTKRGVASEPSSPAVGKLEAPPPPPPGSTVPPVVVAPATGLKPSLLPAPVISRSGSFDLPKLPNPTLVQPDGPFSDTLPYGERPPDTESAQVKRRAMPLETAPARSRGSKAVLVPLSGGAVLLVGAMQLRWLASRVNAPTDLVTP